MRQLRTNAVIPRGHQKLMRGTEIVYEGIAGVIDVEWDTIVISPHDLETFVKCLEQTGTKYEYVQ